MMRLPRCLLLAVAVLLASGCAVSGLAFRVDDRVTITAPEPRSTVTLPVTVEWTVTDVDEPGGRFGVFVDRPPQPPGEPLAWLARDDDSCQPADGCPDSPWLEQRGVHVTASTSVALETLARPVDLRGAERHEVTIVLLDAEGRRIGESAFHVEFVVDRDPSEVGG